MYAPSPGCTARCTTPGVPEVRPCGPTTWRSAADPRASGARESGRPLQRRVRPRSLPHGRPLRSALRGCAVTQVHVHQSLVGQRELARELLKIVDGVRIDSDSEL